MPRMAMGKHCATRQTAIWIATSDLPTPAAHPFYHRLNALLAKAEFEPGGSSPQEFARFMSAETAKFAALIRTAGIKVE